MQPIRKLGYRREWVVSTTPHYVYPPGHRPSTHCTSGWIGFRAGLDENVKFQPHRDSIPETSSPYCVPIPTSSNRSPFRKLPMLIMSLFVEAEGISGAPCNAAANVYLQIHRRGKVHVRQTTVVSPFLNVALRAARAFYLVCHAPDLPALSRYRPHRNTCYGSRTLVTLLIEFYKYIFLRMFAKLWKETISSVMYVRLSAWNSGANGRNFMKFYI